MKERPILFSAPMVRAILDGTKTQTRRVVKLPPAPDHLGQWEATTIGGGGVYDQHGRKIPHQGAIWHTRTGKVLCSPYGQPGDRLWVKETYRFLDSFDKDSATTIAELCLDAHYPKPWAPVQYEADGARDNWMHVGTPPHDGPPKAGKLRPSIFMPRWASRILLEVTSVRVERLQDISEADATAEGTPHSLNFPSSRTAVENYAHLWECINGDGSWAANPWVWVIEFQITTGKASSL